MKMGGQTNTNRVTVDVGQLKHFTPGSEIASESKAERVDWQRRRPTATQDEMVLPVRERDFGDTNYSFPQPCSQRWDDVYFQRVVEKTNAACFFFHILNKR